VNLLFIARGGERTGLGHFARTQKLAETARLRGHDAELFCLLDGPTSTPVEGARAMVDEDVLLRSLAGRSSDDVLVVDTLEVTGALAQTLQKSSVPVVSLSPLAPGAVWANLVILRSAPSQCEQSVPHLIGMEFAVLGQSVAPISEAAFARALDSRERRIAVCFGGADPSNETLATVRALAAHIAAQLDVFVGPAYLHDEAAFQLGADAKATSLNVYRGDPRLWAQLARSSILVGGGGLLAYEAAHSGLPAIHLVPDGIRREMLAPLEQARAIRVVDRTAENPHQRLGEVVATLDPETLRAMRRSGLSLQIGQGHVLCIEAIEDLLSSSKPRLP
jgi:spore coat polysaccharide biosynthesis predicted glycosyltransferase SpsG